MAVPRVDDAVDLDTVRDEAEEIAVPAFDYISQPIDAVVDGLTGRAHEEDRDVEDTQVPEDPEAGDERQHHEV
ncbi:hypothetical protein Drose_18325 [Dactylosporangium roseum]|uniref:Uncharacterized protein n=1 Tax=Dactylosporangium roseum TaxID=47989 RepID=A0ABY5ZD76_9ACTN|nr:hypothetical protein [Dactylosporangium roseum]UWZ39986.1 hypothetical protein Drose_18325 [Dactylosporangium roseum]